MIYMVCNLPIWSNKSLEEVAEIISAKLIPGISFGGREEHIYDEVPAIYAKQNVLGLRLILQGYGGQHGYTLTIYPADYPLDAEPKPEEEAKGDITDFVAFLLKDIPGIHIPLK